MRVLKKVTSSKLVAKLDYGNPSLIWTELKLTAFRSKILLELAQLLLFAFAQLGKEESNFKFSEYHLNFESF